MGLLEVRSRHFDLNQWRAATQLRAHPAIASTLPAGDCNFDRAMDRRLADRIRLSNSKLAIRVSGARFTAH
jgi:hypothetical protein